MKLLERLGKDFPELKFIRGRKFAFRPPKTIVIEPNERNFELLLMHELGHALLKHVDFKIDAERLKMEMKAWEKAREMCEIYGIEYNEEIVQTELDTYRDWLHKKSRCPSCGLTRFQDIDGYHCPRCETFRKSG